MESQSQMLATQLKGDDQSDLLVIGSVAVDYSCDIIPPQSSSPSTLFKPTLSTSNPSKITETIGGVSHNVFTASHFYLRSRSSHVIRSRLVSTVGLDITGRWVIEELVKRGIDTSGIDIIEDSMASTARYVALNDSQGGLFTASADMAIVESMRSEHVLREIRRARPRWVCVDGNLGRELIIEVVKGAEEVGAKGSWPSTYSCVKYMLTSSGT